MNKLEISEKSICHEKIDWRRETTVGHQFVYIRKFFESKKKQWTGNFGPHVPNGDRTTRWVPLRAITKTNKLNWTTTGGPKIYLLLIQIEQNQIIKTK